MKKMLTAVLAALMALCLILPAMAEGEVTIGQALYAAHGTKCFAVLTVAMQDGVIADAYIDEFQFMTAGEAVGVPTATPTSARAIPRARCWPPSAKMPKCTARTWPPPAPPWRWT